MKPRPFQRPTNIKTFGQALKKVRTERGLSHKEVADRVGLKKDIVRQWEEDELVPSNFHLKKLYWIFSTLRFFTTLLPKFDRARLIDKAERIVAARVGDAEMPDDVWLPPIAHDNEEPPDEFFDTPKPKTFGGRLRAARLAAGFDLEEIGELLSVTGQAVGAWELDKSNPVVDHYTKLLDLFQELKDAPTPETQNKEKPNGGKGISKNVGNTNGTGAARSTYSRSPLRAVPTPFDAVEAPKDVESTVKIDKPVAKPITQATVQVTSPSTIQSKKSTTLEEAGAEYARHLATLHKDELRVATLRAELDAAEMRLAESSELAKIAHEKLIEIVSK